MLCVLISVLKSIQAIKTKKKGQSTSSFPNGTWVCTSYSLFCPVLNIQRHFNRVSSPVWINPPGAILNLTPVKWKCPLAKNGQFEWNILKFTWNHFETDDLFASEWKIQKFPFFKIFHSLLLKGYTRGKLNHSFYNVIVYSLWNNVHVVWEMNEKVNFLNLFFYANQHSDYKLQQI